MMGFPSVGGVFGRYHIERLLGRGGMGVVFEAIDSTLNRSVALKVLLPSYSEDAEFRRRFAQEASVLARLDSLHVVQIHEHGEIDGCLYLATQLIRGGDLQTYLESHGHLSAATSVSVITQVCAALADAHGAGVIHRDVKPSNVLLRPTSSGLHAYLCDFGIAQSDGNDYTQTGSVIGSTLYMAPERHEGARADERADIYSVGCLLHDLITGVPPFTGTEVQVAIAHLHAPVPILPETTTDAAKLNRVLERALAKDPNCRYQSATEFMQDLAGISPTTQRQLNPELQVEQDRTIQRPSGSYHHVQSPIISASGAATVAGIPQHGVKGNSFGHLPGQSPYPQPRQDKEQGNSLQTPILVALFVTIIMLGFAGVGFMMVKMSTKDADTPTLIATPKRSPGNSALTPPTASQSSSTQMGTSPATTDPLGIGYTQQNLPCTGEYIVVLSSGESASPATTVRAALDRFPRAEGRYYLDPAKSCSNLSRLTNKEQLTSFPYLGPFSDPVAACDARMAVTDTTTYVIGLTQGSTEATYCACYYESGNLPSLNKAEDAESLGDNRFWTLELQYMLYEAGYNTRRLVGGNFGNETSTMVAALQQDSGLDPTGMMDEVSWSALVSRVCQ